MLMEMLLRRLSTLIYKKSLHQFLLHNVHSGKLCLRDLTSSRKTPGGSPSSRDIMESRSLASDTGLALQGMLLSNKSRLSYCCSTSHIFLLVSKFFICCYISALGARSRGPAKIAITPVDFAWAWNFSKKYLKYIPSSDSLHNSFHEV